ncbi:hypothetical protein NDN08_008129 [Rhodosorus marinus]|uniref:CS domain-containing protein n=1 Tax=Rhodosorus marinus TaxID=101924 RepID=A0AAV8V3H3_9RHOD|nr:hypothetical protein NDN08_008129 [Rhodosorus marinus]
MVDYSKWDNLVDDDDDDVTDEGERSKPVVTKYAKAQSVTIPGNSESHHGVRIEPSGQVDIPERGKVEVVELSKKQKRNNRQNGGTTSTYYWRQDKSQVEIFFYVPAGTKANTVRLEIGDENHLVLSIDGEALVDDDLAFTPEDPEDEFLDWSIEDDDDLVDQRVVRLTLKKKSPSGTVSWCSRIFDDEEPIDLSTVEGRNERWKPAGQVLQEATELFKKRLAEGNVGTTLEHLEENIDEGR